MYFRQLHRELLNTGLLLRVRVSAMSVRELTEKRSRGDWREDGGDRREDRGDRREDRGGERGGEREDGGKDRGGGDRREDRGEETGVERGDRRKDRGGGGRSKDRGEEEGGTGGGGALPVTEEEWTIHRIHTEACEAQKQMYVDPGSGYKVFTEFAHRRRGTCCGTACRHCPFGQINVKDPSLRKRFNSLFYV